MTERTETLRVLLAEAVDRSKLEETFAPNLGLGYLASYLRSKVEGVDVRLIDRDLAGALESFQPHVAGISSVSQNYNRAKCMARVCHESGSLVVIGGAHISALPETLSPHMDLGVIGEGEATMAEIVQVFCDHGPQPGPSHWAEVPGVVFRDPQGEIHRTPARPLIEPLDRIPFPARDLLPPNSSYYHMISSRGCPYNCTFCSSTRFWGRVRFHSPEYVVQEVETLLDAYAPQHITFFDDLFIASRKRLRRIVSLIRERGIHKRVAFELTVRANLVDEETVDLLQRMNVFNVIMGLESGNDRVLRSLKGNVRLEQNQRAVDLLSEAGIGISATFVIGAPDETREEILDTLTFIRQNPLSEARTYLLTPLPGTPIWDEAQDRGLVSDDMDWDRLDLTENPGDKVVISENLTAEELDRLYARFDQVRLRKQLKRFWFRDMPRRLSLAICHPLDTSRNLLRKTRNLLHEARQAEEPGGGWRLALSRLKSIVLGMK